MLEISQEFNSDVFHDVVNLVQHYVYSPFGKIVRIENSAGADITATPMVDNFYTFTGREYDKESGLYFYRARCYDSETGRFIQSDPHNGELIKPLTFISKYLYVLNNPVVNKDPDGREVVPPDFNTINGALTTWSIVSSFKFDVAKALLFQKGSFFDNLENNVLESGSYRGIGTSYVLTGFIKPLIGEYANPVLFNAYAIAHLDVLESRIKKVFKFIISIF